MPSWQLSHWRQQACFKSRERVSAVCRRPGRGGAGGGGWLMAVGVSRRGLHAAAAERTGAGDVRGAAGARPGRPARQPHHARHAHHGRGRQRNGHQVSRWRGGPGTRDTGRGEGAFLYRLPHGLSGVAPGVFAAGARWPLPARPESRGLR